VIVAREHQAAAIKHLQGFGETVYPIGEVVPRGPGDAATRIVGSH